MIIGLINAIMKMVDCTGIDEIGDSLHEIMQFNNRTQKLLTALKPTFDRTHKALATALLPDNVFPFRKIQEFFQFALNKLILVSTRRDE